MAAAVRSTVIGMFRHRRQAERAVVELRGAGFPDSRMGLVTPHTGEGVSVAEGATVGTLAGLAVAAGIVAAIGPVLTGGLLFGLAVGGTTGAAVGGIVGALVGLDVPEGDARYYEGEVQAGHSLVVVGVDGRYSEAVAILSSCGAYDINRERFAEPPKEMAGHHDRP
jgi:hypothetical protein